METDCVFCFDTLAGGSYEHAPGRPGDEGSTRRDIRGQPDFICYYVRNQRTLTLLADKL